MKLTIEYPVFTRCFVFVFKAHLQSNPAYIYLVWKHSISLRESLLSIIIPPILKALAAPFVAVPVGDTSCQVKCFVSGCCHSISGMVACVSASFLFVAEQ